MSPLLWLSPEPALTLVINGEVVIVIALVESASSSGGVSIIIWWWWVIDVGNGGVVVVMVGIGGYCHRVGVGHHCCTGASKWLTSDIM